MPLRWFKPTSYNCPALFLIAGAAGGLFAWNSFNLVHLAMENFRFLEMFGSVAVMEGGLRQFIGIIAYGLVSLAFYLVFKVCEVELVHRWRSWRNNS